MKTDRVLFKLLPLETFSYFVLMVILLNIPLILITLIIGTPRILIYDSSWILQFAFPLLYSIIWTSINRNGVLKLTLFNDSKTLEEKLESFLLKRGYVRNGTETENIQFVRKSKLGKFFNYIFRENIRMKITDTEILIYSKKHLLVPIEMKFKYDKTS
ncbi:MAG: hypothetical protein RBR40_11870 [Tenuifilaceae bacterium]|nr:hypothetical protein [Tenuifilaceae bacterium]